MKCPNCKAKISAKHYDPDYEWYECPKCGEAYTADEIEEATTGTSVRARRLAGENGDSRRTEIKPSKKSRPGKPGVVAKSKKRDKAEADALAKFEEESLKPRKSADVGTTKHRDEVPTNEILNVWADEIETIGEETGVRINRLNAREFFAMNLWRDLSFKHGVKARDKRLSVPHCADHA